MLDIKTESDNVAPGEEIRGQIVWSDSETKHVELSLIWVTRGKGTEDTLMVDSQKFSLQGPSGSLDFHFTAPSRPYSFSGKLVSLTWAIEANCFPNGGTKRLSIVISPSRREIKLH